MDAKALVMIWAQVSLMLIVASIGMEARWSDLLTVARRPGLLVRGITAVNLVVPAAALAMLMILPMAPVVKIGIFIMAVSPLAPLVPGKMLKAGAEMECVIGLYVALIVLAVAIVPVTIELVALASNHAIDVPAGPIAGLVLKTVILPLFAGLALASIVPEFSLRHAPVVRKIGIFGVLPVLLLIIFVTRGQVFGLIGDGTLLAISVTVVAGLAAGHWLGGDRQANRIALAHAAATRHPGIAALIVQANQDDARGMAAIVLFLLTSIFICAIYDRWVPRTDRATAAPH